MTETGYLSKINSSTVFAIALIILTAVGTIFGSFLVTFKNSDTDKGYTSLGFGNVLTSKFLSYFNFLKRVFKFWLTCCHLSSGETFPSK